MYHTFMAALLNLLSLVSMVILLDCYLGNCNVGVPGVAIALGVISITVMFWLVTLVIYLLELRRYKAVEEKIIRRTHLELIGLPTFDPNKGIVGRASNAVGDEFEVLINPNWWQFIWSGHEAKQVDDNECAVLGSPYVKVQPGGEPKSYVLLKLHGQVIGAGSRVVIDGVDYLLTAYHVWDREPDALSKNGKEVSLPKVEATYYSSDKDMDFSLVQLPLGIWSNLGVQSARVKPLSTRASVTLYGGSASQELISSFGRATCVDGVNIHHHASTNRAWSGSPLYDSRNCVVGVHLGFGELGQYNRASNIGFIARILSSQETMPPDLNFVEITEDELYDRPYDFNTYTIHGFSDVKIKNREYYIPKGKDWSTYAEDDDDEFFDTPVDVFLSTNETSELSLNLHRGRKTSALAALVELGNYSWESGGFFSEGVGLQLVGSTACMFRESSRKANSTRLDAAREHFPELGQFGWPERGSKAELRSLLLQARRFKVTDAPVELGKACEEIAKRYPQSRPRKCFRSPEWSWSVVEEEVREVAAPGKEVQGDSSPGCPLASLHTKNKDVLAAHLDFVVSAVTERLFLLGETELQGLCPDELVAKGCCDPVRLFVKQEPHSQAKLSEGRYRLISSVSLVDQIVERMLFGPQNKLEIAMWDRIPSKPGMGLSLDAQAKKIFRDLQLKHTQCPAYEADISGFDWTVQDWELWADVEIRISLCNAPEMLSRAMRNRFYCFMNSVFQLSDGTLIKQCNPGVMKSGSYCTSSTNSRIRCLMAELIGSPWCIAMGDDSVEGYVPDAMEKYLALGHKCKEYKPCEANGLELKSVGFCSHYISKNRTYLTSWAKTLFKHLHSTSVDYGDIEMELYGSPEWPKIRGYLVRETPSLDKRYEQIQPIPSQDPQGQEPEEPGHYGYGGFTACCESYCTFAGQACPKWTGWLP
nr:MAG: polyprotein P2ab [Sobemovirus sp.]